MSVRSRARVLESRAVHEGWSTLRIAALDWRRSDGRVQRMSREIYDHGDAVTILLHDPDRRTVILVRQFRFAAFLNGHDDLMTETPAGLLEGAAPEDRVRAEAEEETGVRPREVRRLFDLFMSPAAVMERVHFYVGRYGPEDRVSRGGGVEGEGEDIEVIEVGIDEALAMIERGAIRDAKTVVLLQHAALRLFPRG